MFRFGALVLGSALAFATTASADTAGATIGWTQISERVGVDMTHDVSIRTLGSHVFGPSPLAAPNPLDTSVRVRGEEGDSLSLAIPPAISLSRDGGGETLRVNTLESNGAGSTVMSVGSMSFHIGGSVEAAVNQIVPGEYRGVMVIIAQFN